MEGVAKLTCPGSVGWDWRCSMALQLLILSLLRLLRGSGSLRLFVLFAFFVLLGILGLGDGREGGLVCLVSILQADAEVLVVRRPEHQ